MSHGAGIALAWPFDANMAERFAFYLGPATEFGSPVAGHRDDAVCRERGLVLFTGFFRASVHAMTKQQQPQLIARKPVDRMLGNVRLTEYIGDPGTESAIAEAALDQTDRNRKIAHSDTQFIESCDRRPSILRAPALADLPASGGT